MTDPKYWGGDPLPEGLSNDESFTWPVAATIVVRYVPDPATGTARGLAVEYHGDLPKAILAHQLLSMVQELTTHHDFQQGIPITRPTDEEGS